jgi:redox-sensitive bicupin YhaK (pirin superfamily)
MTAAAAPTAPQAVARPSARRVVHKTRGRRHGPITRLMSPSDLGEALKPFVFLDLFEADMGQMRDAMQLHPHSGIATVTVFTDGDVRYEDPEAGKGALTYGGVEWMRAGGGVWHGKEIAHGLSSTVQGFQLWLALPPELENASPDSQYVEASEMRRVGPAHVIVGAYQGVQSPVRAPDGVNYLLVTLGPGESWTYTPPAGHSVAWTAVSRGQLFADIPLDAGDMAVFEAGERSVTLTSTGERDAVFVLGSAAPHAHPLHLGYYSVHTNAEALVRGEARIAELKERLLQAGDRQTQSGTVPVYR